MIRLRLLLLVAVLCGSGVASGSARASSAEACSDAYARGQEERLSGRLYNARTAFIECAREACPDAVARDCRRWAKEVEADLPTVSVRVTDEHGVPVEGLMVHIDGAEVPTNALSSPVVLEAGPHELRFEAPGFEAITVQKALRPTDREVEVGVVLLRPPAAPTASETPDETAGIPTAAWLLAGAGVLALGSSLYFGLAANDEYQDLKDTCAPRCAPSASDDLHTKAVISDIALATSLAAFAGAGVIYFTRPRENAAQTALGVEATPRGGRMRLRLSF